MKGTLHKTNRGWIVKQIIKEGPQAKLVNQYPLVDNGYIDGLKLYNSNEGLEVEFEILTDYDNNGPNHFPKFARIIIPKLMILTPEEDELKDWDVTLMDGLEDEPYISDDFQIGPDDAYEHNDNMTPKEKAAELVDKFSNECLLTTDGGKVAALIAVNEILKDREEIDGIRIINDPYWMEVKQELKKL